MRLDELEKGVWGYKPEAVASYVSWLEAEARKKREEAVRQAEEASSQRIAVLEEALKAAQQENETLRAEQASVGDTLLQAQKCAQQIRAEAEEFRQDAQARVQAGVDRQLQELEAYSDAADALKEQLHTLLRETLGKTEDIQRELHILRDKGPGSNVVALPSTGETGGAW